MYKSEEKNEKAYDLKKISSKNISGSKKAAVLLMTLGADISSNILKKLSDKQIQKIGVEIANINNVTAEERKIILKEFLNERKSNNFAIEGGIEYANSLLKGAFDENKVNKLMEGIRYDAYTKVFITARKADAKTIKACILGESPQTIAIILAYIQPEKSAEILSSLDEKLQREVALKLGTISKISPIVIKAVDNVLSKKLKSKKTGNVDESRGVDNLLNILPKVDGKTERNIINYLEHENNILANEIKANMFTFEDIVNLDRIAIQKVLKNVNIKDVAIALKDSDENILNVILQNQSTRAAEELKEEIELLGKVKVSQVDEAKRKIVNVVRQLEKDGVISSKEAEEEILV
ncbi:flagellar motor switch protein FliG [Clostridium sp. Ade.TY]|uniref:flagellar motor switch protein FliG n=1 Tax=Clostridium sp. Ade.TY TaxID=1391647 RepID=UPI0003F8A0CD|nr:flagellar motor switch protein FliG [Clostridium sp. Ade.TY]